MMELIRRLGEEFWLLCATGFISSVLAIGLFIILWKMLKLKGRDHIGFLVINLSSFIINGFIFGFLLGISPAFDRTTEPAFASIETSIKAELEKQNIDSKAISLNEFKEIILLKQEGEQSLEEVMPIKNNALNESILGLIPGYHVVEQVELMVNSKETITLSELMALVKKFAKKRLLFFVPWLQLAILFETTLLYIMTWYVNYSEKKEKIQKEEALKQGKILL